jgi:hypothetical protein
MTAIGIRIGIGAGSVETSPQSLFGTDLRAWYRGDSRVVTGAGVSQWTDKSGAGRHVVQATDAARPPIVDPDARFGGRAAIAPDGAAVDPDFLKATAAASDFSFLHNGAGGTVFAVVYTLAGTTGSRALIDTCNASGANVGFCLFRGGTTDSNGTLTAVVAAGGGVNAVSHTTGAGTFNPGVAFVLCWTYGEGASPTEWELRLNRAATASGNSTAAPSASAPLDTLCVARLTTSTLQWRGAIAEIALYNRRLATAELQQLETYALSYYGI